MLVCCILQLREPLISSHCALISLHVKKCSLCFVTRVQLLANQHGQVHLHRGLFVGHLIVYLLITYCIVSCFLGKVHQVCYLWQSCLFHVAILQGAVGYMLARSLAVRIWTGTIFPPFHISGLETEKLHPIERISTCLCLFWWTGNIQISISVSIYASQNST